MIGRGKVYGWTAHPSCRHSRAMKRGSRKLFIKGFISVLLFDIRDNYKFGEKVDINIIKKRMLKN